MELNKVYDLGKYAEEDTLLNDWIENILNNVKYDMFRCQKNLLYMSNEREDGVPMFNDNAIELIYFLIKDNVSYLTSYMITRLLMEHRLGHIDLGEDCTWWLQEELGDEEFAKWESAARKAIYADYVEGLGEKRAAEYFERIGRSYYKNGNIDDLYMETEDE